MPPGKPFQSISTSDNEKDVISYVITSLRKIKEGDDQRDRCDWEVVLIKAVSSGGDSGAEICREAGNQLGDPSRAVRGRKPGAQILMGGQGQACRAVQLEGLGAGAPEDSGGFRLLLQVLWKPLEE